METELIKKECLLEEKYKPFLVMFGHKNLENILEDFNRVSNLSELIKLPKELLELYFMGFIMGTVNSTTPTSKFFKDFYGQKK